MSAKAKAKSPKVGSACMQQDEVARCHDLHTISNTHTRLQSTRRRRIAIYIEYMYSARRIWASRGDTGAETDAHNPRCIPCSNSTNKSSLLAAPPKCKNRQPNEPDIITRLISLGGFGIGAKFMHET